MSEIVQHTTTVALKLRNRESARRTIGALARVGKRGPAMFDDLGVHFARVMLLDEPGGVPWASWMILETNFDSPIRERAEAVKDHFHRLAGKRTHELAELIASTDAAGPKTADAIADLLVRHSVEATAEYQGHTHRDLARIELEAKIHEAALALAHSLPKDTHAPELHRRIRAHVKQLGLVDLEAPAPALPDPIKRGKKLRDPITPWFTHIPLLGLDAVPIVLCAAAELASRQFALQERAETRGPHAEALLRACADNEDHGAHNALTHVVPLKRGGWIRARALAGLHRYLNGIARDHFNEIGMLGGIPSIHFAKWMLVDEGRRLLFTSNYDGNWESYLGDFVDGAALGLNAAWTSTAQYPNTIAVLGRGASDEERFKAWARANQRPTNLFYTAYPTSSVAAINNATWFRAGLHEPALTGHALEEWRRRLT